MARKNGDLAKIDKNKENITINIDKNWQNDTISIDFLRKVCYNERIGVLVLV